MLKFLGRDYFWFNYSFAAKYFVTEDDEAEQKVHNILC